MKNRFKFILAILCSGYGVSFAIGPAHAPFLQLAKDAEVIAVGEVKKLSPSNSPGKAIATVEVDELVYGEGIGKELMVWVHDGKVMPIDVIVNTVAVGESYLFYLITEESQAADHYIPLYDGIHKPHPNELRNARRYAKEFKQKESR